MARRTLAPCPTAELRCRLRRVEGQVSGILRMVEDDRSCQDILVQVAAARAALDAVAGRLVEREVRSLVHGEHPDVDRLVDAVLELTRIAARQPVPEAAAITT